MSIGSKIREFRKACGWTQKELSEKAGVATVTIQQYERGVRQPRLEQLEKIAAAFQCSISEFVDVEPLEFKLIDPETVTEEQKAQWEKEGENIRKLISYLETIGYEFNYKIADFGAELYYSLKAVNENELYILSEDEAGRLFDSVSSYTRFLLQDILKSKSPLDVS